MLRNINTILRSICGLEKKEVITKFVTVSIFFYARIILFVNFYLFKSGSQSVMMLDFFLIKYVTQTLQLQNKYDLHKIYVRIKMRYINFWAPILCFLF